VHRALLLSLLLTLLPVAPIFAAPLDTEVQRIASKGAAGQALWGVYAVDLKTGKEIASYNEGKLFIPASNRKLVTAALVTRAFKPTDRISTELTAKDIRGGVATGVVLHAAGDPSWTPTFTGGRPGRSMLRALAKKAHDSGIRRIEGDVLLDTSIFTEPAPLPPGWPWDEFVNSYASRPSAIALDMNLAGVSIKPGRAGEAPIVSFAGGMQPFQVSNNAATARAGAAPTLRLSVNPSGEVMMLDGTLAADAPAASRSIPMGSPVESAARLFSDALREEGIEFPGEVVVTNSRQSDGEHVLAAVEGAPIGEILKRCMEESDNYLAESLYLLASAKSYGRGGYLPSHGLEKAYWKTIKVSDNDYISREGSGLSREDLITPRAMVALLQERASTDWFVESLPVSGKTGTLRYRLGEGGMAGRVQAKTGTLDTVGALSGYVKASSGRVIAFSIIANHHTCSSATIRAATNDIVEALARQ
jgi:D-alanyl-D-alanine carboxypeptidase/D-alanyl-D-alanine-endopeptidase (penicillin-binding protein 4)